MKVNGRDPRKRSDSVSKFTEEEVKRLKSMSKKGFFDWEIAVELNRTPRSIESKRARLGVRRGKRINPHLPYRREITRI